VTGTDGSQETLTLAEQLGVHPRSLVPDGGTIRTLLNT
jgi:hypothetical protein